MKNIINYMKHIGNYEFNLIYEANLLPDYPRPDHTKPSDSER